MDTATLVTHSLWIGLILSVLLSAYFLGLALLDPEFMLRGYPPDIKARYGPPGERVRRLAGPVGLGLLAILLGTLGYSLARLAQLAGGELPFGAAFASVFISLMVFNVWDLVVLDWLVFVTLRPRWVVLPGTEGMAGYGDYGFHFRAFLRGTVLLLVVSLVLAAAAWGVFAWVL